MWCHLCRIEATPAHETSSTHRAARELAAAAVDRLADHLSASVEDDSNDWFDQTNVSESPSEEKSKVQVFYCDSCNLIVPVDELQKHRRQKEHTLELLKEQTLQELVRQYVDKEHLKLLHEPFADPVPSVDEGGALKKYTCHVCAITVPLIFKILHERGLRHLSCRTLTVSASKRTRDMLILDKKSKDKSKDKSGDKSKDKSKDTSGDKVKDKSGDTKDDKGKDKDGSGDKDERKDKFTGKMMQKLLKLYSGVDMEEDKSDDVEETDEQQSTTKANALTTKKYFIDIQQFLPYAGKLYTLIIDDTEYVTIKMGTDYLKIPASSYNGIYYVNQNSTNYMICRMCDGFNNGERYNSEDEQDKKHVMSLGHIKNLLSFIDNVHLIRQIDEHHHFCALCNTYMYLHAAENHVLKDFRHSAALARALELGKTYKDSKKHLKIMVFRPSFHHSQRWNFGLPYPHTKRHNFGYDPCFDNGLHNHQRNLFGSQNASGFNGQNNTFGFGQTTNFGNRGSLFSTQSFGAQPAQIHPVNDSGAVFGGQSEAQIHSVNAPRTDFGGQTFGTQSTNAFGLSNSQKLGQTMGFGRPRNVTQNPAFWGQNTGQIGLFGNSAPDSNQGIFGQSKDASRQNSSSVQNETTQSFKFGILQVKKSPELANSENTEGKGASPVSMAADETENSKKNSTGNRKALDTADVDKQKKIEVVVDFSSSSDSE